MKKLLSLWLAITLAIVMVGCAGKSWQNDAGKLLSTTVVSVDAARQAWAIYVVEGKATQEQRDQVENAVRAYQAALRSAQVAYGGAVASSKEAMWSQMVDGLVAARNEILSMIKQFSGFVPKGTP